PPGGGPAGRGRAARAGGAGAGGRRRRRAGVYLLGFGGYVREQVLPHFRGEVVAAVDHKAALIRAAAAPPFPVHDDPTEILEAIARDPRPLVIVATYHSEHARLARAVLDANPAAAVLVEKPAALTAAEGVELAALRREGAWIEAGYNRRHAPLTAALREGFRDVPRPWAFTATVKELKLPANHWYRWENQGTRVSGNACHWLDLARHLLGVAPVEVSAIGTDESFVVSLAFEDGSVAAIAASAYGDDLRGVTERIELRGADVTGVVDDFRALTLSRAGRTRRIRRRLRDKGHAAMYRETRRRWLAGEEPAYPAEDLAVVAWMTEVATAALRRGDASGVATRGGGA
ncbi:MAG: Gfo/Idh/MocA family oxidoreductase, partial [Gemmatimonadetes bacterium]|nr:Gfo/Idh/MocA family oxidoreductase [Gemmatimonadota bacterium]